MGRSPAPCGDVWAFGPVYQGRGWGHGGGVIALVVRRTFGGFDLVTAHVARCIPLTGEKSLPEWHVAIVGEGSEVVARAHKTLYVRKKRRS